MNANINEDELELLAYLHEHAKGYDKRFKIEPQQIGEDLLLDMEQLGRRASFLEGYGLAVMMSVNRSGPGTLPGTGPNGSHRLIGVFLTALGEDYMRELEKQPEVAKKLTVKVVKELWGAGKGIIVGAAAKVLGEIAMGRHP